MDTTDESHTYPDAPLRNIAVVEVVVQGRGRLLDYANSARGAYPTLIDVITTDDKHLSTVLPIADCDTLCNTFNLTPRQTLQISPSSGFL